jgi:hypothetical protein
LATVPVWHESDDNPPLPPRAAIAAPRPVLGKLVKGGEEWELDRINLRRVGPRDVWVYDLQFFTPLPPISPNSVGSFPRSSLSLIVLMDGRTITPIKGVRAGGGCRIDKLP